MIQMTEKLDYEHLKSYYESLNKKVEFTEEPFTIPNIPAQLFTMFRFPDLCGCCEQPILTGFPLRSQITPHGFSKLHKDCRDKIFLCARCNELFQAVKISEKRNNIFFFGVGIPLIALIISGFFVLGKIDPNFIEHNLLFYYIGVFLGLFVLILLVDQLYFKKKTKKFMNIIPPTPTILRFAAEKFIRYDFPYRVTTYLPDMGFSIKIPNCNVVYFEKLININQNLVELLLENLPVDSKRLLVNSLKLLKKLKQTPSQKLETTSDFPPKDI